ncbi:MAG: hypothetical protein J6C03_05735 [Clostridia bacterium]|nr:hypothetical protein [Clostridia bacterium]
MTDIFLTVFNLSITASWMVIAVLLCRVIFKKAPKNLFCILWLLVGLRLAIPFSIESVFSLIPSAQTIPPEIIYQASPEIQTGIGPINDVINPILNENFAATPQYSANPIQILIVVASYVWIIGIALVILYGIISYTLLRLKVRDAVPAGNNIRLSEKVSTPFILGFINPKIYIPVNMDENNLQYILAHEKAHIKRRDHLIKPIGFALLAVYWFNPMMWLAYIFLCRDIELACDEKVVRDFAADEKARYASALLDCSVNRKYITACPLAFGEVGVKERIKNALNYKKPMLWIIVAAVISAIIITVCFMTNPKNEESPHSDNSTEESTTETTPEISLNWDIKKIGYATELAKYMCGDENGNGCIKIIHIDELEEFLSQLSKNPLKDITDPIEKVYFENNLLLAVYYTSGSGSNRYSIENVYIDHNNKTITVSVLKTIPEVGTDDMSGWLGFVEIKNIYGTDIADYSCTTELSQKQYSAPNLKKDSIKKADDWKTEGLKSAGLEGVEITYTSDISQGKLYLLEEKDPIYVIDKHFFLAVEKGDQILLAEAGTGVLAEYIHCCDVDGEQGDEILFMIDTGGNGGAGSHSTYVYNINNNKISNIYHSDYSNNNHGFSTKLIEPFKVEIKNNYTGYTSVIEVQNEFRIFFDEQGKPKVATQVIFDCIYNLEPRDVDNDGIYELICKRYSSLGLHSSYFGDAVTTLKYDKSSNSFKIIDAEFIPYKEKHEKVTTEFYELITFTQKPTDSHFTYTYTVWGKNGDIFFGASSMRKPNFQMISEDILRVYTQAGTGLSTRTNRYFDVEKELVSEEYTCVLNETDSLVAYGEFNGTTYSLIVKDIFHGSYKKEFSLDNIAANIVDPIISAEFSDDSKYITVTYFVGNNDETAIIDLPL